MMQNARLDESQSGIKIAGENVNNLRCADDTTVMAESEEELKSLLRVKEERGKSRLETQQPKNLNNCIWSHQFSSVAQSCLTLCDPMKHTRPPCPSPAPRVYSNWCPLSRWCHPTISSSVVPFSSSLQSFPTSGFFQMSQFVGGQSIGVLASVSVLPMNIQDWFPLGWTGWISLQSTGLLRVFSNPIVQEHQFISTQLSL